jgi:hypothetical protein
MTVPWRGKTQAKQKSPAQEPGFDVNLMEG